MFDIIGKRNWFFLFSGLVVVPGLIFILLTPLTGGQAGLKFSVDYTGGTVWEFQLKNAAVTSDQLQAFLVSQGITDVEVSEDTSNYFTMRTKQFLVPQVTPAPSPTPEPSSSATAAVSGSPAATPTSVASASASAAASASPSPEASSSPTPTPTPVPLGIGQDGKPCQLQLPASGKLAEVAAVMSTDPKIGPVACTRRTTNVGPIVSSELIQQAILLILFGSIGILVWIGIRFRSLKFGATALAALVHDVIVVVGLFAIMGTLFGVQIDALFVTAMLTVIGFSVHDTIVVYDRIRENRARHAGEPFDAIVNHSILQTFGRSINTSFTVVLTLFALLLFAGAAIKFFVLALLIGIVSGTYSSIFNASPLLVVWQMWEDKRRAQRLALARGARRGSL